MDEQTALVAADDSDVEDEFDYDDISLDDIEDYVNDHALYDEFFEEDY